MKIRAVIDTNVLVSSFYGGNPREIIRLWEKGKIIWCLSEPILIEYLRVLKRLQFDRYPRFGELWRLFLMYYNIEFLARPPALKIEISDPEDLKFLECAVALKAQFVISGDRDLLALRAFGSVEILSPGEFLDRVL